MRRVAAIVLVLLAAVQTAHTVPPAAGGALGSANVDFLANIPDLPAIGGRILGGKMYVTTIQGVRIYDVSTGIPLLIGALELPHWQNEDADTDGRLLLVAADYFAGPSVVHNVVVIDVSIPHAPLVRSVVRLNGGGHTVSCVGWSNGQRTCDFAWTRGGDVLDLRDPSNPVIRGRRDAYGGHDTNVDAAGIAWTGNNAIFDIKQYSAANLMTLPLLGSGAFGWHNSLRPDAELASATTLSNATVEQGELVYGTDENWLAAWNNICFDDGPFVVSRARSNSTGTSWWTERLATFKIGRGTVPNAKPAAATCSSHFFDEHDGVVATAWMEQGIRFLDVTRAATDRRVTQIGYFMPAAGSAWMARFNNVTTGPLPGLYVYTFDVIRGIDVLRFTGTAGAPEVLAPGYNPVPETVRPDPEWGYACRVIAGPAARA